MVPHTNLYARDSNLIRLTTSYPMCKSGMYIHHSTSYLRTQQQLFNFRVAANCISASFSQCILASTQFRCTLTPQHAPSQRDACRSRQHVRTRSPDHPDWLKDLRMYFLTCIQDTQIPAAEIHSHELQWAAGDDINTHSNETGHRHLPSQIFGH